LERIGINENLFELGGTSLMSVVISSEISKKLAVRLAPIDVFQHPSIAELSEFLLQRDDSLRANEAKKQPSIPLCAEKSRYRLSPSQKRYWIDHMSEEGKSWSHLLLSLNFSEQLNPTALEAALNLLIDRHESLRTSFELIDEEPFQFISEKCRAKLEVVDLSALPEGEKKVAADRLLHESMAVPFNLKIAPALRTLILRLSAEEYSCYLMLHHLIADGWSLRLLREELLLVYEDYRAGRATTLKSPKLRYRDFAEWQNGLAASGAFREHRDYWLSQLSGPLPDPLFTLNGQTPDQQNTEVASCQILLPPTIATRLEVLAKERQSSLFLVLLAGFFALLHKLTGRENIIVGSPLHGREHPETQDVIGFFVNLVMLRTEIRRDTTFGELLRQVHDGIIGAMQHQSYQPTQILHDLGIEEPVHSYRFTTAFFSQLTFNEPVAKELQGGAAIHKEP